MSVLPFPTPALLLLLVFCGCAAPAPKAKAISRQGPVPESMEAFGDASTPADSPFDPNFGGSIPAVQKLPVLETGPAPRISAASFSTPTTPVAVEPVVEEVATPPTTPSVSLPDLEQLALRRNPAIQQAIAWAAKAGGVRTQVGLKANPTVGYFGQEIGNEDGAGLHGGFISQTIVRGDKLRWNRRVINHDLNAMNWQVATQRQRVLTDLQVAFYEALAAQQRLQLAREFLNVVDQGVEVSRERLLAKVGTRPDLLQSEIQRNEVMLLLQQAEFEFSAALNELAAIVGVDDLGATTVSGELPVAVPQRDIESEYARITAKSPLLNAALARVDRACANLQRQNVQAVPNVMARLGAGTDDVTGNAFANVQLGLPIPLHNWNQGNIRAAYAEHRAAVDNVEQIRMSIRQDLARAMREYQVAEATTRQYHESILPKAKEALELIQKAQVAGEFDFLRVFTARRAYFDANLKLVAAQGKLAQANAKVEGLLLTGGLSSVVTYSEGDQLRRQALGGQ